MKAAENLEKRIEWWRATKQEEIHDNAEISFEPGRLAMFCWPLLPTEIIPKSSTYESKMYDSSMRSIGAELALFTRGPLCCCVVVRLLQSLWRAIVLG